MGISKCSFFPPSPLIVPILSPYLLTSEFTLPLFSHWNNPLNCVSFYISNIFLDQEEVMLETLF